MDLTQAQLGKEYIIENVATEDEEMDGFLFTLAATAASPSPWSPTCGAAMWYR